MTQLNIAPTPADTAAANFGGFYVADSGNRRIEQFAADRSFVREWGGFGSEPGKFVMPATVVITPSGVILRIRWFPVSATNRFPAPSIARAFGPLPQIK